MSARRILIGVAVVFAAISTPAWAIVEIGGSEGRYELAASAETPRSVILALADRFEFEVVFPDDRWGRERRDFVKRGSLDDLVAYVLVGTNFVARYWRPEGSMIASVTRVEILGNLKISGRLFEPVEYEAPYEDEAYGEPQADDDWNDSDENDPSELDYDAETYEDEPLDH